MSLREIASINRKPRVGGPGLAFEIWGASRGARSRFSPGALARIRRTNVTLQPRWGELVRLVRLVRTSRRENPET
jgi:hypothetical protein